tara:strand:+ start:680 stop:1438 length:759 start_codon:yes stop_codon:yes gene_type:complete
MATFIDFLNHYAILIAAMLATVGWLITVRVNTSNSRSAHTFDIVTKRDFNSEFRKALRCIRPYLVDKNNNFPGLIAEKERILSEKRAEILKAGKAELSDDDNAKVSVEVEESVSTIRSSVSYVLNHYEFLCAGIRSGDISEKLIKDTEKSTILLLFETFEKHISDLRVARKRNGSYEHLAWIYDRWDHNPPGVAQSIIEIIRNRPLYRNVSTKNCAIVVFLVGLFLWALLPHHRIFDDEFWREASVATEVSR